jgi:RNA polymerase sigma-70 factor (ECF subfamily)
MRYGTKKEQASLLVLFILPRRKYLELRLKQDIPTISQLYDLYHEDVHKRIYFLLANYHNSIIDADDLSQETWVKVTNSYHKVPENWDVKAWVLRVAVNVTIDFMRRKKRKAEEVEFLPEHEQEFERSPEEDYLDREAIYDTYRKMREPDRIIVGMYAHGYNYDEIREATKVTTKSGIKMSVSRSKKRFRDTFLSLN